jgi:hypothetical protein
MGNLGWKFEGTFILQCFPKWFTLLEGNQVHTISTYEKNQILLWNCKIQWIIEVNPHKTCLSHAKVSTFNLKTNNYKVLLIITLKKVFVQSWGSIFLNKYFRIFFTSFYKYSLNGSNFKLEKKRIVEIKIIHMVMLIFHMHVFFTNT